MLLKLAFAASYVSIGVLCQLNARLPVRSNEISAHINRTLIALDHKTIIATV